MPYFVYIIQSAKDDSYYKGFTENPLQKLSQHNNREAEYIPKKIPWKLVALLVFESEKEALIKEKKLKKHYQARLYSLIHSAQNQLQIYLDSQGG